MSAVPVRAGDAPGGRLVSHAQIQLLQESVRVGVRDERSHADPVVNVTRQGDRVQRIEVRCGCGEVIQIDCEYP